MAAGDNTGVGSLIDAALLLSSVDETADAGCSREDVVDSRKGLLLGASSQTDEFKGSSKYDISDALIPSVITTLNLK